MSSREEIFQERDYENSNRDILKNTFIGNITNPFERIALIEYKELLSRYIEEQSKLEKIQNKLFAIKDKKTLFKKLRTRALQRKVQRRVKSVNSYDRKLLDKENSKHIVMILMREKRKLERSKKATPRKLV